MPPSRGFTLPELIATLGIGAIVSGLLLPSFSGVVGRHGLTSDANILLSIVVYARSEAIKRNGPVVICRSNDGATCLTERDDHWNEGLLVFADDGRDRASPNGFDAARRGNGRVDPGESIVRSECPLTGRTLIGGGPASGSLRFEGDGRPYGLANTTFTLTPRDGGAATSRRLVVSATGRPRVVVP